ncbi:MAG: sugar transferase [Planctomycetota bacterium]|jgi:exopolysaccharide biosynthesis polyprenyl glycosylphosphotransferase|nr:sugar transferase [Planctomycetota bacterium]
MLAARLKNIFFTLLATDVFSSCVAFVVWCSIIYHRPASYGFTPVGAVFFLTALFLLNIFGFLIAFYHKIVYCSSFSHSVTRGGFIEAQINVAVLGAFFLGLVEYFSGGRIWLLTAGYTATTMILITLTHMAATRFLKKLYNAPGNKLSILLVGMNRRTGDFSSILNSTPHLGCEIRGYLDYEAAENSPLPFLGLPDRLDGILKGEVVDVIFIFLPVRSFYDDIQKVIETAAFYGVTAHIVGNVFEADGIKKTPLCINDFGSMAFSSTSVNHFSLGVKRIFDIAVSFLALVFISPLLLLIAVFIKIRAGGPAIFRQERIGLNKRTFTLYKFRTMVPDAERRLAELSHLNEMDGAAFKIAGDPRLIPGGSFLRKYSLDELPQLWNVLRGDMSLVGPRPLSKRDYDHLREDWQRKRFSMRPGLTCIWQVSGRNEVPFNRWMEMDLAYIGNWNLGLDFQLLLRTIPVVFAGGGR